MSSVATPSLSQFTPYRERKDFNIGQKVKVAVGWKKQIFLYKYELFCPLCGKRMLYAPSELRKKKTDYCIECLRKHTVGYRRKFSIPLEQRSMRINRRGYYELTVPYDHWCRPMTRNQKGLIHYHRLVMAEHLGRLLGKDEYVHHINGIKTDNRIENLQLVTQETHSQFYAQAYKDGFAAGRAEAYEELKQEIRLLHLEVKQLRSGLNMNERVN